MSLSVAIVCKNNEETIGRTLESVVGLATEIVALDSGSTDGTISILETHGAKVTRTQWKGHVATKQMALEACGEPWILCLDSDESLEQDLLESVRAIVNGIEAGVDGYRVNRKVYYKGRFLNHAWQPEFRLRLVRKGAARWGGLDPHDKLELIQAGGPMQNLRGTLRHDSFATISDHLAAQAAHARTMAASLIEDGARPSLVRLVCSPGGAFLKQMVIKQAWRDGWRGWAAASSAAAGTLMKHAVLLEMASWRKEGAADLRSTQPGAAEDAAKSMPPEAP